MKNGRYEVGDVIAFRVKRLNEGDGTSSRGDTFLYVDRDNECSIVENSNPRFTYDALLERIPNPKLMGDEWWVGWMWKKWNGKDKLPSGAMILVGGSTDEYRFWCNDGKIVPATEGVRTARPVLIPPESSPPESLPCPELKAKIEKMESELAELKKQALGKEGN